MKSLYFTAFLLIMNAITAAETNVVFVTDDGSLFMNTATNGIIMDPRKVEGAKNARESLPAEMFPDGNWGMVTNGFQLSLRFEKQVFKIGEPIVGTILLRNTTDHLLTYLMISFIGLDGPADFVVTTDAGTVVPSTADKSNVMSSGERPLFPRTQHKYIERLDKRFNFETNIEYTVKATYSLYRPARTDLESANVKIAIR